VPPASSEQIASELHDVIAHALSAMTVQAAAARRTALTRPELARAAYAAIEAAGREALRELRRLREESPLSDALSAMVVQAGGARRVLERDPSRALTAAAGIERTGRDALHDVRDRLGAGAQRAPQPSLAAMGERASLEQRGERRALPAGLDLAAYRIVEEALADAGASVSVEWGSEVLALEVRGGGEPSDGVRERVRLYDGVLAQVPDGWRVTFPA
jgi:signal transduction histidine kinase